MRNRLIGLFVSAVAITLLADRPRVRGCRANEVGSFHSDALHVSERFVPINADTIEYTAVITDPKVYTRPWTLKLTFERLKDYGLELYE